MLKNSFHGFFQPRKRKTWLPTSFIFNGLQSSKMVAHPCAAHRLSKNSFFQQPVKTIGLGLGAYLLFFFTIANATVYQSNEEFVSSVFEGKPPSPSFVWMRGEIKTDVANVLGHPYSGLRIRYWKKDQHTAWVLEEIGKERPITTGIEINNGSIARVRVLAFRESRGGEVRYDFFTKQFKHAQLKADNTLNHPIDGITGATLSVNALKRLARLALYLDSKVQNP